MAALEIKELLWTRCRCPRRLESFVLGRVRCLIDLVLNAINGAEENDAGVVVTVRDTTVRSVRQKLKERERRYNDLMK